MYHRGTYFHDTLFSQNPIESHAVNFCGFHFSGLPSHAKICTSIEHAKAVAELAVEREMAGLRCTYVCNSCVRATTITRASGAWRRGRTLRVSGR